MTKKRSGRPTGSTGPAVALDPHDIQSVLKIARRERYASRAELLVMLSTTLGLRASELSPIKVNDVYASEGCVRTVITICRSFLPGKGPLLLRTSATRPQASQRQNEQAAAKDVAGSSVHGFRTRRNFHR
jgi:integrase